MMKKILTLAILITLFIFTINSTANIQKNEIGANETEKTDSYLIKGVPYVSQETGFFCEFASKTIVFKYFGADTDLKEVVYCSGIPYSHTYASLNSKFIPYPGVLTSQRPTDNEFLSSLFGLKSNSWILEFSPDYDGWEQYWPRVKENISSDKPVISSVSPFCLPSVYNQFSLSENIMTKVPGGHAIVINGYNESNQSVCYSDAAAAYFGNAEYGNYTWTSTDILRNAINKTHAGAYIITSFSKVSEPKDKDERFRLAYQRNKERLKSNMSCYSNYVNNLHDKEGYQLGINATKQLKQDYTINSSPVFLLKRTLRLISFQQHYYSLGLRLLNLFGIIPSSAVAIANMNMYKVLSKEKEYAVKYLENNQELNDICPFEKDLFRNESELWLSLCDIQNEIISKAGFVTMPFLVAKLNQMSEILNEIIKIEEKIISS